MPQWISGRIWLMIALLVCALCGLTLPAMAQSRGTAVSGYDPLAINASPAPDIFDLEIHDQARNRSFPVRVYAPPVGKTAQRAHPVILFSHGLGGSRTNYTHLGQHWVRRGYVVIMLQHPGSDDTVWRGQPVANRMNAMKQAAGAENLKLRTGDVRAMLDALEQFARTPAHPLYQRVITDRIGMSGHSFGAHTTQAVSGQYQARKGASGADPRIMAALAMSPSPPALGSIERAFGAVDRPWMLMTGTDDDSPIGSTTPADRLKVFPALPPGGKYQLVFAGGDHMLFSGRSGSERQQHAVLAFGTAFWDCWLRGNKAACGWLDQGRASGLLTKDDLWATK